MVAMQQRQQQRRRQHNKMVAKSYAADPADKRPPAGDKQVLTPRLCLVHLGLRHICLHGSLEFLQGGGILLLGQLEFGRSRGLRVGEQLVYQLGKGVNKQGPCRHGLSKTRDALPRK